MFLLVGFILKRENEYFTPVYESTLRLVLMMWACVVMNWMTTTKSKFICIPTRVLLGKAKGTLSALTSFVDAAIMHKPVLVSDNTNMGVDVDGLGIGLTYKAGDAEDMRLKMQHLLSLTDEEYKRMCKNMEEYSKIHNYETFCNELVQLVSSE